MKRADIISQAMPVQTGPIGRTLGRWLLGGLGWRVVGKLPEVDKVLIIVAPHTSNWDYVIGMGMKFFVGLRVRYLMKSEINRWPFRALLKWTGGVPVYRFEKTDIIAQTVDWVKNEDNVWLAMAPEGTRSKLEKWKTGFLRIAHGANIPLLIIGIDARKKQFVIDKVIWPQELEGDLTTQAKTIQTYFLDNFEGINPEKQ